LTRDRTGPFTEAFDVALASAGIKAVTIPPHSPRANGHAELRVRTARAEIADPMLIAGTRHLRAVPNQYAAHRNEYRPHRGRNLRPPGAAENTPAVIVDLATPRIRRRRSWRADQRVRGGGMKITG
jgi:putative transposase